MYKVPSIDVVDVDQSYNFKVSTEFYMSRV